MDLQPTKRFSVRAEAYVRYRPGYPPEIIRLLQRECGLTPQAKIADIGSGPGFLSELFLRFGCEVFGVEPNPEMRAAGERLLADEAFFYSVDGRAESTTLSDASVDFVTAGQALHWFDPEPARAEFRRILKPGGWVIAVWNERKIEDSGFMQAYEVLLNRYAPEYPLADHRRVNRGLMDRFFGHRNWRLTQFPNRQSFDFEGVRGRLESSSYAPLPDTGNYGPLMQELERLFHQHQQNGQVTFVYETNVYAGPIGGADDFRLITLDPGHFHAGLIQKEMYSGVSPRVAVYAPLGPDLIEHMNRVVRFNLRKENPTCWEMDIHAAPDFLERMLSERLGNIVVLSGRNRAKIGYIRAALDAGLHVLADKPWIIRSADLPALEEALAVAETRGLIAYDIMTERYEITSILQRELVNDPEIFGSILSGTEQEPAVYMESVHHILKRVAGVPNLRPVWFFDIDEQGEALSDVGTHLVDLVQWMLFPEQAIDYRNDIQIFHASRWPTVVTPEQFQQVTGEPGGLDYYCNTRVSYALRGIHTKLDVLWRWEALPGTGDTHLAVFRGSQSRIEVRQGQEENYRPQLYVIPAGSGVKLALTRKIAELAGQYPGIAIEDRGSEICLTIPDSYRVGHEAHFAQVTNRFFEYLKRPKTFPNWENANMFAKYYVTTNGVELSRLP